MMHFKHDISVTAFLWLTDVFVVHNSHVFDLSPGSGAAAIACIYNGITYNGVCANEFQEKWLSSILDMATMAVLSGDVATHGQTPVQGKENADMIKQYFATAVAEAKRFLREGSRDMQDTAANVEDDSDEDE